MAEQQLSMFETTPAKDTKKDGLLRLRQPTRPLTKAQQLFNKRVARVEQLRDRLDQETLLLDKTLEYYGAHLHPRLQRLTGLRKDLVRGLAPYLNDKRIKGKNRKKAFREILANQIDQVAAAEGTLQDTDLRELFERLHRVDFEKAQAYTADAMRAGMESMLEDMGIAVDLSGIGPGMNEESFAAKFAEITGQIEEQFEEDREARGTRRKSKKELEKEQRLLKAEELRKKSIATIYRQLARALHPDLESNAELRQRKTLLMQELTTAYRHNDLHTLLRLELEWIQRERTDLDRLTDEKLAIYNDVLKEQADDLRDEIEALPYHPRYAPLVIMDGPFGSVRLLVDAAAEAYQLDQVIKKSKPVSRGCGLRGDPGSPECG